MSGLVWGGVAAGFFYAHWQEKVVVALVSGSLEVPGTPPFEISPKEPARDVSRISAPLPERPGSLPRLPESIRARAASGAGLILFPTDPNDVAPVATNWAAVLESESWSGTAKEEGHLFFVSFEVGDDPSAYARLLRPERALWQSLHRFHPSPTTEYHLRVVEEALELGDILMGRFLRAGRRSYHVALQALCDTAARTLVFEKRDGMKALAQEAGATSETPR
jgi:hypothetical protein